MDVLMQAVASGSIEDMNQAVLRMGNNFLTAETGTRESLERQAQAFQQTYDSMISAQESGMATISESQLADMEQLIAESQTELLRFEENYNAISQQAMNEFLANINNGCDQCRNCGIPDYTGYGDRNHKF